MPIGDKLLHSLAIVTPTTSGTLDDYGQPVAGEPTVELVSGLIQPSLRRRGEEILLSSQAGAELADHVVFLAIRDLSNAAYIRFDPDDGDRYQVVGIRRYEFGTVSDHLEVDCHRITSEALVAS
jgi:hypothetical protein